MPRSSSQNTFCLVKIKQFEIYQFRIPSRPQHLQKNTKQSYNKVQHSPLKDRYSQSGYQKKKFKGITYSAQNWLFQLTKRSDREFCAKISYASRFPRFTRSSRLNLPQSSTFLFTGRWGYFPREMQDFSTFLTAEKHFPIRKFRHKSATIE